MKTSSYYRHGVSASLIVLLTATLFLAYTNGANDNFKGFATLLGSRTLTYRQALTLLVLGASRLGVPVSTTHVSVGAIIGIGVVARRAHAKMVLQILTAWVTTLPLAMLAAGLVCLLGRAA